MQHFSKHHWVTFMFVITDTTVTFSDAFPLRVNQMGRETCQTTVIFLYSHPQLQSLSLGVYLGRGCSRISSVFPWPLPPLSTLPTQTALLPTKQAYTSGTEREGERERARIDGGWRAKTAESKQHPVGKKFLIQWEENSETWEDTGHGKSSLPN